MKQTGKPLCRGCGDASFVLFRGFCGLSKGEPRGWLWERNGSRAGAPSRIGMKGSCGRERGEEI